MRALLTVLLTVAAAVGAWVWISGGAVVVQPPAAGDADEAAGRGPAVPVGETAARGEWERVHRSLDRILQRLTALEARFDAAPAPAGMPMRADAAPTTVIDTQQLRRALDEIDQQRAHEKYASMGDKELLAEVGRLQWKGGDLVAADAALRQLLARDLGPDERATARTQLGMLQRQRHDLLGAERTLRAVVDERGMRDKAGGQAAYQLAWTLRERDPAAALGVADALAQQADEVGTRTRARWTAARLAEELGDVARARADYQALLATCGDSKELADVAKDARYRLDRLNGN
jgi:hypothetical protein